MNDKIIKNLCRIGDKCILEIDGSYFGYDDNHPYPETLYSDANEAYVFKNQSDALSLTSWFLGNEFTLIPIK